MQLSSGAAFDLNGLPQTIASLADGAPGLAGTVTNSSATPTVLTIAPTGGSTVFSGVIQDGASPMSLTINGPGTQILAGSNTYSGLTTITAGTLQIGNSGTTGSIDNTSGVVDNGVLAFNRTDTVTLATSISGPAV